MSLPFQDRRILVIAGAYGSGKSEISLNLAQMLAEEDSEVVLIDLDFVNPYFRSREWAGKLGDRIRVISGAEGYQNADLPALSGEIEAQIRVGKSPVLIDLGGDPVGARVLGRFAHEPRLSDSHFWLVVNPYRPFTESREAMVQMARSLEQASGLVFDGVIANPNLLTETTITDVTEGFREIHKAAASLRLPIKLLTVDAQLHAEREGELADLAGPDVMISPLHRHLLPPW